MAKEPPSDSPLGPTAREFERAIRENPKACFVLTLFVSGMTPQSRAAIDNITQLCRTHLDGRYKLDIVDIYQQPTLARDRQIIAAPTLVKVLPPPLRKVIGDLGDPGRILLLLGITPPPQPS